MFCIVRLASGEEGEYGHNVLAGALFGPWIGLALICSLTALGATCCFLFSRLFAKPLVEKYLGARLSHFKLTVAENRHRLFYFLLFARLFPASPNWLLNICSPFVDIPIVTFFTSVLIGLIPYNFVCAQAGGILSEIKSVGQIFDRWTICRLFLMAVAVLIFAVFSKKRKSTTRTC
uniref:Transmembrane protein 41A n=1 Tax=Plectus sambesii TaxID=2011161 RepID=A0A914XKK5_9BILA